MSSNVAAYDNYFNTTQEEKTSTAVTWEKPSTDWVNNNQIKIDIKLPDIDLERLGVETITDSATKYSTAFLYYPYSMIASIILAVIGAGMIVTFFIGIHSQLFIAVWILIIGLGMARTLTIASKERHSTDGRYFQRDK